MTKPSHSERFWQRVDRRSPSECWPWTGPTKEGYGQFQFDRQKMKAHRAALILSGAQVPARMHVDHACRNRACCNPAHLRVVTFQENTFADGSLALAAVNARKTHCDRGHPLSGDNLYLTNNRGKPARKCRECHRIKARERHARKALSPSPEVKDGR